jgi:predicted metal-binding membrane protein
MNATEPMAEERAAFDHLDGPGRLTAFFAMRPRLVVNAVVAVAVLLSWGVLAILAVGAAQRGLSIELGPGAGVLAWLPDLPVPDWASRFLSICAGPVAGAGGAAWFLSLWAMWVLMAVATMLPSATPMIRTYCEIADTAGAGGERVVHPLLLVAGYLTVWALAALPFSSAAYLLAGPATSAAHGLVPPIALAFAGAYQFTRLKEACLDKCRNPFAILFSRWSTKPSRIFRLGVEQGLWCLGCCWALMLVMFAVGAMNIFWMALIGFFAIVEKQWDDHIPGRAAGAILLVWAALLGIVSL